jgi:hypothetical protein
MDTIKTLLDRQSTDSVPQPTWGTCKLYGEDLRFPATVHPNVIANFAATPITYFYDTRDR